MKQITTLLLIILAISCSGQNPDTHTYSDSLFKSTIDSVIAVKDSVISDRDQRIINLQSIVEEFSNNTATSDTFNFHLQGITDDVVVTVKKVNEDIWVNVINENKRIEANFINNERTVRLMDSTYQVGVVNVNSNSTKGFSSVDFNH